MNMLEDNDHYCRALSLKVIAELAKYGVFHVRTA